MTAYYDMRAVIALIAVGGAVTLCTSCYLVMLMWVGYVVPGTEARRALVHNDTRRDAMPAVVVLPAS